jgi:hypothetical protein
MMRGSSYPRGTYCLIFLAAWWWVGRSWYESGRVNVADLTWALGTALLMVLSFRQGFAAGSTVPTTADSEAAR